MTARDKFDFHYRPTSYLNATEEALLQLLRKGQFATAREAGLRGDRVALKRVLLGASIPGGADQQVLALAPGTWEDYSANATGIDVEITYLHREDLTRTSIRVVATVRPTAILYRMEDHELLSPKEEIDCNPRRSRKPLTLRKLIHLIDTSRHPVLEDYYVEDMTLPAAIREFAVAPEEDWESAAAFVSVTSVFYPQLERYYEQDAERWLRRKLREDPPENP
jgi:hypothetical protein